MGTVKKIVVDGKEYMLFPIPFVDNILSRIDEMSNNPKRHEKLIKLGGQWIRRTLWEDLSILQFEARERGEEGFIPITKNEFNWLKKELENPI
jgi:hypothetical protein